MGLSRLLPRPNIRASAKKESPVRRVIAFANQKGGVAKTTTTLNLGVALKEKGHTVLAVDLDPQGNLTMSQGWNPDEITLSMIRENLNPDVEIEGILPTMFDKRLLHSKEAVEILKENFGDLVYQTKIRKTIRYAEAPVKGQSVLSYDPNGDAAALYRDLAKEVLNGAKAREHA